MEEGSPSTYLVAKGVCFIKRSEDPTAREIVKVQREVGHAVHTTGRVWKGPQGGKWVEVDVVRSLKDEGWMLVEGPGFGSRGPFLVASAGDVQLVEVRSGSASIFSCLAPRSQSLGRLIGDMCAQTGLRPSDVILTKGLPAMAPSGQGRLPADYTRPDDILYPDMTVESARIVDALNLVYMGDFPEDSKLAHLPPPGERLPADDA